MKTGRWGLFKSPGPKKKESHTPIPLLFKEKESPSCGKKEERMAELIPIFFVRKAKEKKADISNRVLHQIGRKKIPISIESFPQGAEREKKRVNARIKGSQKSMQMMERSIPTFP